MKLLYVILITTLISASAVLAVEYHVNQTRDNQVIFRSEAPLEDIEGVTEKIDGYVFWDREGLPEAPEQLENSKLYFEVELKSIETGIGLRDRHMRENYLETDKFPYAYYTAKLTEFEKLSDTLYTATAEGTFHVHGKDRPLTVESRIVPEDEEFRVFCNFVIKLTDYKIKIPKLMFLKINENIELELNFHISPAADIE